MNRPIIFRAWDEETKKMIQESTKHCPAISFNGDILLSGDGDFFYGDAMPLMQFTGLFDKNGKEIFEGDVIKWSGGAGEVKFGQGRFYVTDFFIGRQDCPSDAFSEKAELEVVGNVFENPDLLSTPTSK